MACHLSGSGQFTERMVHSLRQPTTVIAVRVGKKDAAQMPRIETKPRRAVRSLEFAFGMGATIDKRTQSKARIRKQAGRTRDAVSPADEGQFHGVIMRGVR